MALPKDIDAKPVTNIYPLRSVRPCPECGKPSVRESYPFCSPRCRAVDLNRWLSGNYILPGRPLDNADDAE